MCINDISANTAESVTLIIMNISDLRRRLQKNIVFKNAFYLGVIQIINYVFPILTIPYLIKVLGVSRFGTIAYSQLIVSYLCIVCDYGFNMSTTRVISLNKGNTQTINQIFSAVIYSKLLIGFVSCLIVCLFIIYTPAFYNFKSVYLISVGYVLGQILFPTWLFQGMEQMGQMTFFNSLFKLIFTLATFLLIKSPDDILLVSIIYTAGSLVSGGSAFVFGIKKYNVKFKKVSISYLITTIYEGFDVFLPSFFSSVLSSGGIIVLGMFYPPGVIGYYTAIDRLVKAGIALLSTVTQSLFPNISYKFTVDKNDAINTIWKIGKLFTCVLLTILLGAIIVSPTLLAIIYNTTYKQYAYVLDVLLLWTVFAFVNNFIGIQFLVGSGNSKFYRKAFLISGLCMVPTFTFIKFFAINGVLFSTLFGEIILTIVMIYFIKKHRINDQ